VLGEAGQIIKHAMPGSPLPQEDNKILLMHRARLLEVQAAAATHFAEVANPGLMPPDILPNRWWESERQSAAQSNGVAVKIGPAHENMDVTAGRMPPVLIRRGRLSGSDWQRVCGRATSSAV